MTITNASAPSQSDAFAERFAFQLVAASIFFYAMGPVLARSADTTGVLISIWRLWFGSALFGAALLIYRLLGRAMGSRRGVQLAILAGSIFSVNQVAFFTSIKRTSVVDASLIGTLSPVFVALLAIPLFGERPGRRFRWWSLVSVAGAVLIVLGSSSGVDGDLIGMLLAVLSTFAFACFFVTSKMARPQIPVLPFLTVALMAAAFWVTLFVFAIGLDPSSVGTGDRWRAVAMAIVPGGLGHIAMTWPLNYLPANVPPLFRLATPAVAGGMAWIFLGEGFTLVHVLGGVVIIAGIAGAILSKDGKDLVATARSGDKVDGVALDGKSVRPR